MKIVLAPAPFKGTMTSKEVISALKSCLICFDKKAKLVSFPLADGGDGTLESYKTIEKHHFKIIRIETTGPFLNEKIKAQYLLTDRKTAIIESCQFFGLVKAGKRANPFLTTTYGLGEAIKDALNTGIRNFKIGLGGSSTNDLGSGMLQALGMRFLDKEQKSFIPTGGTLDQITSIDTTDFDSRIKESKFSILTDVTNPLLGTNGATYVFAKQKGACLEELPLLEKKTRHFNDLITKVIKKDISSKIGSGACGGLGACFLAFTPCELISGANDIISSNAFQKAVKGADFIITGEGHIDSQTLNGKAPYRLIQFAFSKKIPVLAIGGQIDADVMQELSNKGNISFLSLTTGSPLPIEELKKKAKDNLTAAFSDYLCHKRLY
ncbi:MAG: glycerate kinase [Bacilli bacterium]